MGKPPANLPVPSTPLIGRESEIRKLTALAHRKDVRLITLTGPGGSGKTRLGLEVAVNVRNVFRDGVFFVDLASIRDPDLVLPAIAQTLNIKEESLKDSLHTKEFFILLDNFEQVTQASLDIANLLAVCPKLKILVTSRERLRVRGEHELPVLPLTMPNPERDSSASDIATFPAIKLFIQRAREVNPNFTFDENNASIIAKICHNLDGLPLAIELAAAQSRLFTPEIILKRLEQKLKMLPGHRDLPTRQRTLQATFEWSYELLKPHEQLLLMHLSVFGGGATLDTIQEISGLTNENDDLLNELDSLVNKNLLRLISASSEELRFTMLETIREFALKELEANGDAQAFQRAHADHFLTLAKKADELRWTSDHTQWLNRLEAERDNLRDALRWALDNDQHQLFVKLAGNLWLFWSIRGPLVEGRVWLDLAAKACEANTSEVKSDIAVNVLIGASELARLQGDSEQAIKWKQKVLEICRLSGEDKWTPAILHDLAIIYADRNDCKQSLELAQEAIVLRRKLGKPSGIAHALGALFYALMCNEDLDAARKAIEESTQIDREQQNHERLATDLIMLIHVAIRQKRYEDAQHTFRDFMAVARTLADQEAIAMGIQAMGVMCAAKGNKRQAAHLLGAAEQFTVIGGFRIELPGRAWIEHTISEAKAGISETTWKRGYKAGQAMVKGADTTVSVIDALAEYQEQFFGPQKTESLHPAGLTTREMEILKMLQGLTDHQVAENLVISPRTVNAHLTSIYHKIGVSSRTAAARFAIENELV